MKAAVVYGAGQSPRYADFHEPLPLAGEELVSVRASALSQFTRSRASGRHYSASGEFPAVAGSDGVGVTQDGRRVYFALPEAPFGAMAERSRVSASRCVDLPPDIDDVTAAAIANPGMSAWAALVTRAGIKPGETVLINGAAGIAGRLAVQLARYLGASRVIATARNAAALQEVRALGADVVIPFDLESGAAGAQAFEQALKEQFARGVDIVVDYLWGKSAEVVMAAIAKAAEDCAPVRFVHVGASSGADILLPGAALRSSAIVLMGSGIKSVPFQDMLDAVRHVYAAVGPAALKIATRVVPLSEVENAWADESGKERIVFVMDEA
ncbi:zinc-binding alcohol dehydrogenase family protein [Dyella sp. C9]|uniref:quinone oxidoreductase family protein n=1 Tax=Dyella sp. C9 TaxID=2202154 RepID=UPI000DEF7FB7|nr:zinc-binding alcohol dehydrogenase family protein [Dyella sp. C9]